MNDSVEYFICKNCKCHNHTKNIDVQYDESYWSGEIIDPDGNKRTLTKERDFKIKNWYGDIPKFINQYNNLKVLDVCCGLGFLLSSLNTKNKYGIDISKFCCNEVKKNFKDIKIFYQSYLQDIKKYQDLFKDKFSENHLIILGINNFTNLNDTNNRKYFNSLIVLNHQLEILSLYNKINLVPFGEFLPFEKILSKFGLKKITPGYSPFSPGDVRATINLGNKFNEKLILPLICYEIIYSGKIKKQNQFPDLVINISEDAWFGRSIGPYQHFTKAIYRSIEEGVFIARSANKGISAFINPNGEVLKSLNTGESGNIELNFPYFNKPTLFSNYGNKIFFLIILLYIFLTLIFKKLKI